MVGQERKVQQSLFRRLRQSYAMESVFGTPKVMPQIRKTKTMILGAVEQSYGIYQVPTFKEQVDVLWNDPLVKEAITMFAEQVCATGFFLTGNPLYALKLPAGKKGQSQTALEVIQSWCKQNKIDTKMLEIAIELKAFGNSFWKIDDFGFSKIPIESVWHAVRVEPDIELQEHYNIQEVPIYGGKVIPWEEFIHFRVGITGYHAPVGQGVIYSLLAKPVDSAGNVAPSIYDVRLNHRRSLDQGMKNFSFGNVWIGVPNMSNEDFEAQDANGKTISDKVASMSPTGNRIITNTDVKVALEVPERTQSYDAFIKDQRDEFFMSLADPSLKLGLEQGFTKATSITASEVYQFKISNMRRTIKQVFEDLFDQILDKLGYDSEEADIALNFGPEETAEYAIADLFQAQAQGIVSKKRIVYLLTKYHKWDVDDAINEKELKEEQAQAKKDMQDQAAAKQQQGGGLGKELGTEAKDERAATAQESETKVEGNLADTYSKPIVTITPLNESPMGFSTDLSKLYIDPLMPEEYMAFSIAKAQYEQSLMKQGVRQEKAREAARNFGIKLSKDIGIDLGKYGEDMVVVRAQIKARGSQNPEDLMKQEGY